MKTRFFPLVVVFLSALLPQRTPAQSSINWEPNTAPPYWVENFTHEDQSTSRVLVFQSTPGVSYTVETSHDLSQWTKGQTFYGLGQEIAIPMIQTAAPPPNSPTPPSGNPPLSAVSKIVSLMLRPTANNGVVINWHSLDNKLPVEHHFSSLTMDEAWESYLYYMKQYGGHYFCISHPLATAIPKINATLGPLDAAMVASFAANFATMNAEVADAVDRARLNPITPAPFDPNSRKFFRIVADWSLDSDFDLSPDWIEFMGMLGVNGMLGSTTGTDPNGNPFEVVSNPFGDAMTPSGQAVGAVLDTDGDGISDVEDMHPTSKLWNKKKIAVRFACVQVDVPTSTENAAQHVLQTNSKGQVLFSKALLQNGQRQNLGVGSFTSADALAMNDKGEILGRATDDAIPFDGLCLWTSATAAPHWISTSGSGSNMIYAALLDSSFYGSFGATDLFTDSRRFCAAGKEIELGANPEDTPNVIWHPNAEWKTSANGQVTQAETTLGSTFVHDASYIWGHPNEESLTSINGKTLSGEVKRMVKLDESRLLALSGRPTMQVHAMIDGDKWSKESYLFGIIDASSTGIAALFPSDTWLNNKRYSLAHIAPGIGNDWKAGSDWHDVSPKGHMLLVKSASSTNSVTGYTHEKAALAFPFILEDNAFATGVDDQSVLTTPSDNHENGYQEKLWVMAPQGTWSDASGTHNNSNAFTIKVPLNTATMTMTFDNATTAFTSLTGDSTALELSGTGSQSQDSKIKFAMNGQDALSFPIGVKSMKKRTVNVHLYRCYHGSAATSPHGYDFDETALTQYLNDIYGPQINTYFSITSSELYAGQSNLPNPLYPTMNQDGVENFPLSHLEDFIKAMPTNANADIRVLLIGHTLASSEADAIGATPNDSNTVVLSHIPFYLNLPEQRAQIAMHTLAHEIGHVFLGEGHPEQGSGPAPLPGTDHSKRLMNSRTDSTARLLVKAEWDKAEEWLKKMEENE
jgi:hypothetical protein